MLFKKRIIDFLFDIDKPVKSISFYVLGLFLIFCFNKGLKLRGTTTFEGYVVLFIGLVYLAGLVYTLFYLEGFFLIGIVIALFMTIFNYLWIISFLFVVIMMIVWVSRLLPFNSLKYYIDKKHKGK